MSGVKKIGLFLVSLLPGQQHTEAEMVWSSPQQFIEEKKKRHAGWRSGVGGVGYVGKEGTHGRMEGVEFS